MGLFGRASDKQRVQDSYLAPDGVDPLCPHCAQTVEGMYTQEVRMTYGKTWLYFCTKCRKVLGVSQRKGFWMG